MKSTAKLLIGCVAMSLALVSFPLLAADYSHTLSIAAGWAAASQAGADDEARRQTDELVRKAREAMSREEWDVAEGYLDQADRLGVKYDSLFARFVDTPQKARRDLQQRRQGKPASQNGLQDPFAQKRRERAIDLMAGDEKARAKTYLAKGRAALQKNDANTALAWYRKAVSARVKFDRGEYSPAALAAELSAAGVAPSALANAPTPSPFAGGPPSDDENMMRLPPLEDRTLEELKQGPVASGDTRPNPFSIPLGQDPLKSRIAGPRPSGSPVFAPAPGMAGPVRLPAVDEPNTDEPAGRDNSGRADALRLVAQAQAALDRGDVQTAHRLATRASHAAPESVYAATDKRPWQLLLEIEKRMKMAGRVAPASAQRADFAQDRKPNGDFSVEQGVYRPDNDTTQNMPAQAVAEEGASPSLAPGSLNPPGAPPFAGPRPSFSNPMAPPAQDDVQGGDPLLTGDVDPGTRLYREGVAALQESDRAKAVARFREAWQHEKAMDPQTRQRLQDMLGALRASPNQSPANLKEQGTAQAMPLSPLEQADAEKQILRQKLFREISAEQSIAQQMKERNPRGAQERIRRLRERVMAASLPDNSKRQLLTLVDRTDSELASYIRQNAADIDLREQAAATRADIERERQVKNEIETQLAGLVDEFNTLLDQERYAEAEIVAKKAYALAPDLEVVKSLMWKARFVRRFAANQATQDAKEEGVWSALHSVEESSTPFDDRNPFVFGNARDWAVLTARRSELLRDRSTRYNEAEMQIFYSLKTKVDVRFIERPLAEVLHTLGAAAGVPVFLDPQGLAVEGITSDTPVTIDLSEPISLKSALQLILQPLGLSYIVQNEVLKITSETAHNANVHAKTYYVADLVIPIPNFIPSYNIGLPGAIRAAHQALGHGGGFNASGNVPFTVAQNQQNESNSMNPIALANYQTTNSPLGSTGGQSPRPTGYGPGGLGGAALADFDSLIDLITATIAPESWDDVGGPGSVQPFPTNLSIVVSQTQEVHEQIADLLDQLRRLQDLQVTIEVRFITLADNFFERIGVNFEFDIDDNVNPDLLVGGDRDMGPSLTVGLDPIGQPTADLDIPFTQGSFGTAIPAFGGFDAATAANFGVAILSDIEVFFLLQAAQGDTRTNILQAPKVTLFNGQQAFVSDVVQMPFVTAVIPVVGDFAAAHQPVVVVLSEGTSLSVQAVVSADRRFVRLTLVPFFSKVGNVQEFTFDEKTTVNSGSAIFDPDGAVIGRNEESVTREGITVQLPNFAFTSVTTTVSVPDGGTVLLGGIKRLREGRTERGVPLLSKLPYVNRLFKNVGIGRETESLMMMVTPRIIIQEEEEEKLGIEVEP